MDIYTKKYNYKVILFAVAVLIAVLTAFYTNYITQRIAKEEKLRAKLWAEAIVKRANLVKYTNDLFSKLAEDERKKVNVWAQSTKFLVSVENNEELTFFSDIVTSNTDIPVILTDQNGVILNVRNYSLPVIQNSSIFDSVFENFRQYPPLEIRYGKRVNFIYYKDSNLFSELKSTLNEIISSFITEVVLNSASTPVLLTDDKLNLLAHGNIDSSEIDTETKLLQTIKNMESAHEPIAIDLGEGVKQRIYYDDSEVLTQLKYFPFAQLAIFAAFALFSYLTFSSSRRAEQNQVWVGLAKETAHQLGTPISSLAAWVEYLKENKRDAVGESIINELETDVDRLTLVADRFSKIGAQPQLHAENVYTIVQENLKYFEMRASKEMRFSLASTDQKLQFMVNKQLFSWVLENLIKNALDAMEGVGALHIAISDSATKIYIDVSDSGCGIPKGKINTIFEPGFSTKRRGWGLGLSLTKRIVEEYHNGKIFVKQSEMGKGTTFRVEIPKV